MNYKQHYEKYLIEIDAKLELLNDMQKIGTKRYDDQEQSFEQVILNLKFFWERKRNHLLEELAKCPT